MEERFSRTERLIGTEALNKLKNSHIALFGVGGVGGYVAEALARCGVGKIDLIDKDVVSQSNINRQIIALTSTIGQYKTEVMKQRIYEINPNAIVTTYNIFYGIDDSYSFDFSKYDYVIDAVDNVTAKIKLAVECSESGTPIISSMGTGNKLDPTKFVVTDIYKTSVCPLARVMRHELKKRGIKKLKVVYSTEQAIKPTGTENSKPTPASIAYVPSVAGLIIASEVCKDILSLRHLL